MAQERTSSDWRLFATVASFILLALMASSTPLYAIYAAQWHFSPTEVYAAYAIAVLVALLLTGGLSDLIGRRPVMATALVGLVGAEAIFTVAGGLDWLYAARTLQGLATGLLLGAAGAALIDHHPRRDGSHAGLVNGIASVSGIGIGAFVSGLLVQYAPYREVTPFVVIGVLAAVAAVAAWRLPETVETEGRSFSLTPRIPRVPKPLARTFGLSALGVLASWSVGGLYLSLGPGVVDGLFSTQNHAAGGLFVFAFCAFAALGQWLMRGLPTRTVLVGGALSLALGSTITAITVSDGSRLGFAIGTVFGGVGFGGAFMGALRALATVIPPAERASVMAAFFVAAYAAISIPAIPAIGAGVAAVHIGLDSAVAWFGAAVAVVAAIVAVIGWFELRPMRSAQRVTVTGVLNPPR